MTDSDTQIHGNPLNDANHASNTELEDELALIKHSYYTLKEKYDLEKQSVEANFAAREELDSVATKLKLITAKF